MTFLPCKEPNTPHYTRHITLLGYITLSCPMLLCNLIQHVSAKRFACSDIVLHTFVFSPGYLYVFACFDFLYAYMRLSLAGVGLKKLKLQITSVRNSYLLQNELFTERQLHALKRHVCRLLK